MQERQSGYNPEVQKSAVCSREELEEEETDQALYIWYQIGKADYIRKESGRSRPKTRYSRIFPNFAKWFGERALLGSYELTLPTRSDAWSACHVPQQTSSSEPALFFDGGVQSLNL